MVLDRFSLGMTLIAADFGGGFSAGGERRRAGRLGVHGELGQDAFEFGAVTRRTTRAVTLADEGFEPVSARTAVEFE